MTRAQNLCVNKLIKVIIVYGKEKLIFAIF